MYLCILTYSSRNTQPSLCEIDLLSKDTDAVVPSGYTAALYVSSQVMFEDIIYPEFEEMFGEGADIVPFDVSFPAYYLTGSVSGSINFQLTYFYHMDCGRDTDITIDFSIPGGNFNIKGESVGTLRLTWSQKWTHSLIWYDVIWGYISCTTRKEESDFVFHLKADQAKLPVVDSEQKVSFPPFSFENSEITYDEEINDFKNEAGDGAVESIKKRISNLRFRIAPVSIFALTNLLFPEAKVINTKAAFLPGDMLILGNIVKDYNPNP